MRESEARTETEELKEWVEELLEAGCEPEVIQEAFNRVSERQQADVERRRAFDWMIS